MEFSGPLATVWLAANLDKKLSRPQLLHTDIPKTAQEILNRDAGGESRVVNKPVALRVSGQLLYGVVKIYTRQENFLHDDAAAVLSKLKSVFKAGNLRSIILPPQKTMAKVSKLILQDTITESNILGLQQPLDLGDLDIGSLAGSSSGSAVGSLIGDLKGDLRHHDRSVEVGRNAMRIEDTTLGIDFTKHQIGDHENVTEDSRREDTEALDGDLVLDFGDGLEGDAELDLDEDRVPQSPIFDADYGFDEPILGNEEQHIGEEKEAEAAEVDATIEHGREAMAGVDDMSFGADALMHGIDVLGEKRPVDDTVFAFEEPIQTVEEEQEVLTEARAPRKRPARRGPARERRRRLVWDTNVELEAEFEAPSIDDFREKRQKLRKNLSNSRKLYYLRKYTNPAEQFVSADRFAEVWDYRKMKIDRVVPEGPVQSHINSPSEFVEPVSPMKSPIQSQEPQSPIGSPVKDMFDVDFGSPINHEANDEDLEHFSPGFDMQVGESFDTSEDEDDRFLQKYSVNDLASSLADSRTGSQAEGLNDSEVGDDQTSGSQTVGSQIAETQYGADEGNTLTVSRGTLQISQLLKNEFVQDKKQVTFNEIVEMDKKGDEGPLSNNSRKERVRCFFELLVLATGDAVSLNQDSLYGEISVGCKDGIFERF